MKKILSLLLAVVLVAALALPALAAYDRDPDDCPHKWGKWKTSEKATCISRGIRWRQCKWCGIIEEEPTGYGSHKYGSWHVQEKATCTERGLRWRQCKYCGDIEEERTPKTGHSFGSWKVTKSATCVRQGQRTRTCKNCGYKETEKFYADHSYGPWVTTKSPTCTSKGLRLHSCEVCGKSATQSIDMLPHDYEWKILKEATDHSSGTRAQVCRMCGHQQKAESYDPEGTLRRKDRGTEVYNLQQLLVEQGYLNAGGADGQYGGGTERAIMQFQKDQHLNPDGIAWPQTQKRLQHDFGPWTTVKALTRSEPGERIRTCKDCGYVQRETIEAGGTIERGSRGENVRALQQLLKQLGYDAGGFDGIYGQKLDTAFENFYKSLGLTFEPGKVRPADLDRLVNAWLQQDGIVLNECTIDTPVNLALTVTPSTDETSDENATTYTWTLTNLGKQSCVFNALLLDYGAHPDFTADNLVMAFDGFTLKPNCQNSVSGSFIVSNTWGDGNRNFTAMAVTDKDGKKWLSNTVTFETAPVVFRRDVKPADVTINPVALENGRYSAAFDRGDIAKVTSGVYMNAVHIFTMDTYDAEAIEALATGDTVTVEGREIAVETVETREETVVVNGGLGKQDGCEFIRTESGDAYRVQQYDDLATYTDHGMTTLMVDPTAAFLDSSDLDEGTVTTEYDDLVDAIQESDNEVFNQYNTTLTIENGRVVEINRIYVP